jgi:hypothetical protein
MHRELTALKREAKETMARDHCVCGIIEGHKVTQA